jgi:hypothetical protein
MQPSIDINQPIKEQLKTIATRFDNASFVPCVHNSKGQKPPCKDAKEWAKGWIKIDSLDNFDFKCLGLLLGTEYLAIDCDGKGAITLLEGLIQTYGKLPNTLKLSSNPGVRECYIFKINRPVEYKTLPTGKIKEQLEFRTGQQYQIVGGLHPSGNIYLTNNAEIAGLPSSWYDYLNNTLDNFVPETAEQMQLWTLLEKLRLIEPFFGTDYDTWLRVGMIVHSVDASEKGLELWSTWSRKFPGYETTEDDIYIRKWDNFNADKDNVLTLGSLYYFLQEKDVLTEETETLVKQLDEVVQKGLVGLLEKEAAEYKEMSLTREQIPMFASKIVQKVLKGQSDRYYIDYVVSYLSEDSVTQNDIELTRKSLETLFNADKAGLNVDWILQDTKISFALSDYAEFYNIPKEYLLISFLTSYSSVLSKKFVYNFNLQSNVIPTLFSLLICEATGGKSEVLRPFLEPLQKLAAERNNRYIDSIKAYELACDEWKKLGKEAQHERYLQTIGQFESDEDISDLAKRDAVIPEPKKENQFLISDASFESIKKLSGEFKDYGLLIAPDEITDLLTTINQITKQKDSLDKLIAVWNGETTLRNRISGELEQADFFQVSLLSGIQTKRFNKFFDVHDPSGIMSRFLMIPMEPINIPTGENVACDSPILPAIVEQLYAETQQMINFSNHPNKYVVKHTREVIKLWGDWRNEQDQRSEKVKEINEGFAQWLRRNPLYTARIALVIHALRHVEGLENDLGVMSIASMQRAIVISKWLTEKAQIVFNQSLIDNLEQVDPGKTKIFKDLLKKLSGKPKTVANFRTDSLIRRKDVVSTYGSKVDQYLKKPGIVALFQDAAKHGLGTFDNKTGTFTPTALEVS